MKLEIEFMLETANDIYELALWLEEGWLDNEAFADLSDRVWWDYWLAFIYHYDEDTMEEYIEVQGHMLVKDKLRWVTLEDNFKAKSWENYMKKVRKFFSENDLIPLIN